MFPSMLKREKSRGTLSPTFLEFQKQRRNRRRIIRKIFKKKRTQLLLKAFNTIYYYENRMNSIHWKQIEDRFSQYTGKDPPLAIIHWFLED